MSTRAVPGGEETRVKAQYRVTNWREYDRALVERGSLTVWFDEEFVQEQLCTHLEEQFIPSPYPASATSRGKRASPTGHAHPLWTIR